MWEEFYSALSELPAWLKKPVPFIVEATSLLRKCEANVILDIGCGLGRNSVYLAKEGFNVVGIDTAKSAIKKAQAWLKMEGIQNASVVRASMTAIPFRSHAFHAVISVSVIHHALKAAIQTTTKEIRTILKNDGVFIANLLSRDDCRYGLGNRVENGTFLVLENFEGREFPEIHHFFSKAEILTLLMDFARISLEPIQTGKGKRVHKYWKVIATK